MSFLDKLMTKEKEVNIEEFLNNLDKETEDDLYEDADAFVKTLSMGSEADMKKVADELKEGNIILLNIGDMAKRDKNNLKTYISKLKAFVSGIDGDMAMVTIEKLILTPHRVKIVKKRK